MTDRTDCLRAGGAASAPAQSGARAFASRFARFGALFCCFAWLCFALAACGPAFTAEDTAAFVGYWELVYAGNPSEEALQAQAKAEAEKAKKADEGNAVASDATSESEEEAEPIDPEDGRLLKTGEVLLYKEWGLTSSLTLVEDGTCTFIFFGDTYTGTWKMEAPAKASIELTVQNEGKPQIETYALTIKDDRLIMDIPDLPIAFKKTEPPAPDEDE